MDKILEIDGFYVYRDIKIVHTNYSLKCIPKNGFIEYTKIIDAILDDYIIDFILNFTFNYLTQYFYRFVICAIDSNFSSNIKISNLEAHYVKSFEMIININDELIIENDRFETIKITLRDKTVTYEKSNMELKDEKIGNHLLSVMTKSAMK